MQRFFPDALHIRALRPDELTLGKRAGTQLFELLAPFRYQSAAYGELTIPPGFLTDFGSVPHLARWYVDDDSPDLLYPSLPHDWLYACRGQVPGQAKRFTRYEADDLLREAMRCVGARRDRIAVVFAAVRVGGRWHWR